MKYQPKEIKDEVNITPVHPLVNFGYLLGTVVVAGVALYAGLGLAAEQIAVRIGPETEEKIGSALLTSLFSESEILTDDPRLDYLQSLTTSLRTDALDDRPPLKMHILDEPLPNAMVIPGGYVFVTTGLLESAETENELAFVLSHELGHFQSRDALRSLGRSLVFMVLNSALGLGNANLPRILPAATNLAELNYSRTQESAADQYAMEVMIDRYGHGGYSLEFFRKLSEEEFNLGVFNTVVEWQSTHPLSDGRIETLEGLATQKQWPMTGEATPLPDGLNCFEAKACTAD